MGQHGFGTAAYLDLPFLSHPSIAFRVLLYPTILSSWLFIFAALIAAALMSVHIFYVNRDVLSGFAAYCILQLIMFADFEEHHINKMYLCNQLNKVRGSCFHYLPSINNSVVRPARTSCPSFSRPSIFILNAPMAAYNVKK